MSELAQYEPGPAYGAQVEKKEGDKWTLILTRELRHPPEKVWRALTDPAHLREWAPFDVDGTLGKVGTVNMTWSGTQQTIPTRITRAEEPRFLEWGDARWELEPMGGGTRLTLWHNIDRRYIAMGTAGWHISLDVMDRLLGGNPIGRIAGADSVKFAGWQRLLGEYSKLFGVEKPKWGG